VMPTPFESAQLILSLYETRREETMRKARDFFFGFSPANFEEFMAGMAGPNSAYIRMVMSYWEMAASFVQNGAIDKKMFTDANGEFLIVFAKLEPILAEARAKMYPGFLTQLEALAMSLPNARETIDATRERIRAMAAARTAQAKA